MGFLYVLIFLLEPNGLRGEGEMMLPDACRYIIVHWLIVSFPKITQMQFNLTDTDIGDCVWYRMIQNNCLDKVHTWKIWVGSMALGCPLQAGMTSMFRNLPFLQMGQSVRSMFRCIEKYWTASKTLLVFCFLPRYKRMAARCFFFDRFDRKPKCLILENPLGKTCCRNLLANSWGLNERCPFFLVR